MDNISDRKNSLPVNTGRVIKKEITGRLYKIEDEQPRDNPKIGIPEYIDVFLRFDQVIIIQKADDHHGNRKYAIGEGTVFRKTTPDALP